MAKKMLSIAEGREVAFNTLPDAVWFTVVKVEGFVLTLREAGTNYATQTADKSMVVQVREPLASTGVKG
jgi:hypothetical protein